MSRDYAFTVGPADTGRRLDVFIQTRLPQDISRVMIQRAIKEGHILVNGGQVKANHKVRESETVTAAIESLPPKPGNAECLPEAIPIEVVYEDAVVLVVNKPPGLVTHPAPGHWQGTLVNAVLHHLALQGPAGEAKGGALPRAGIVHRLDKDTSGLLLIAKTERAHHVLAKQLKEREMKRGYIALVDGEVTYDEGSIDAALGRHPTQRKEMAVKHLGGRSACTHYRVIRRLSFSGTAEQNEPESAARAYTLVDVELDTGRTHQIRVHFAHIGHPVLGDAVYGKRIAGHWRQSGIERQLLHAWRLKFKHPTEGHPVVVYAPLPADMRDWVDAGSLEWIKDESTRVRPGFWRSIRNKTR